MNNVADNLTMLAICLTAYDRPKLLKECLESVKANPGHQRWKIFIGVDPAPTGVLNVPNVLKNQIVWVNAWKMGWWLNTFQVMKRAVEHGAKGLLLMDDDTLLSPDALEMCEWFLENEGDYLGLALCRKYENAPAKPYAISVKDTWMGHVGQGFFFSFKVWQDFVKRRYWVYKPHFIGDNGDIAIAHCALDEHRIILRPCWARAQHRGEVGYKGKCELGIFPESIANVKAGKYQVEAGATT